MITHPLPTMQCALHHPWQLGGLPAGPICVGNGRLTSIAMADHTTTQVPLFLAIGQRKKPDERGVGRATKTLSEPLQPDFPDP
jgi:hypothetical protein